MTACRNDGGALLRTLALHVHDGPRVTLRAFTANRVLRECQPSFGSGHVSRSRVTRSRRWICRLVASVAVHPRVKAECGSTCVRVECMRAPGELPARRFNCRRRWTRRRPVSVLGASFRLAASPAELLFCRGGDFSGAGRLRDPDARAGRFVSHSGFLDV